MNSKEIALVLEVRMLDLMGYDLTLPFKSPLVIQSSAPDNLGRFMHFAERWLYDEDWRKKASDPSFMDNYTMEKVDGFTNS